MAPRDAAAGRQADSSEGLSPPPGRPSPRVVTIADLQDQDDDDTEFEPSTERSETSYENGMEGEDEDRDQYVDAQDNLSGIEIAFSDGDGNTDEAEESAETGQENSAAQQRTEAIHAVTPAQLLAILRSNASFRQLLTRRALNGRSVLAAVQGDEDNSGATEYEGLGPRRMHRPKNVEDRFPKVSSEEGKALMRSGIYGSRDHFSDLRRRRKNNISERLMWRRLGLDPRGSHKRANRLISQDLVPSTSVADKIIHYDSRAYSGQFSDDGNFFFSCTQNFKVRMYDTSNPYEWKYYKTVIYPFGQWTITDATLSPDNRWLAYSSIRHMVCLAPTDPSEPSDPVPLDLTNFAPSADGSATRPTSQFGRAGFGIWSLRFSGNGREIVAGTSAPSVVVFDLETQQSVLKLTNHNDDVNAVCFGDDSSPHILYSGSDDQTLRVWDRRSMADGREAGVFVGHTEGLTYVDSKGDGRYVLSNGKDQTMKLWDLRKMMSPNKFRDVDLRRYTTNFDYRFSSSYDPMDCTPNPHDCSVVTFGGHNVLKTLIRCHFGPAGSTNSRYVYSGSEDGNVWIWNLDGTVKGKVDVRKATLGSRPRHPDVVNYGHHVPRHGSDWKTCVRDASWHPYAPVLAATSWNGWGMASGTVSLHSWNDGVEDDEGDPPLSTNYNARLDIKDDFNEHARMTRGPRGSLRSRVVRPSRFGQDGAGDEDGENTADWGQLRRSVRRLWTRGGRT